MGPATGAWLLGPVTAAKSPTGTFGPGRPARGRQANSPFRRAFFPGPHYSAIADLPAEQTGANISPKTGCIPLGEHRRFLAQ